MLGYNKTIAEFYHDVIDGNIVSEITQKIKVGPSEQGAWQDAAIYMKNIFEKAKLPNDIEIGMELKLPIGSSRIDFLIAGLDSDMSKNLIIVELKRWSKVTKSHKENLVNAEDTRYGKDALHPSYQAYTYKLTLESLNSVVHTENMNVNSCSYLHNLRNDKDIKDTVYKDLLIKSPIFSANDNNELAEFIKKHVNKPCEKKILYEISNGVIKPSKMLIDSLKSELSNNPQFTLLEKQEVVYQNIISIIKDSYSDNKKHVIIVQGGAGTGKSVIAIKLMNYFIKNEKISYYITKNSAVRNVYSRRISGRNNEHLRTLFKSAIMISRGEQITDSHGNKKTVPIQNLYECLIIDEAHRLPERSKSGNILLGKDLIKEIIQASKKFAIFFIDEKQQVDIRDYATVENISDTAKSLKAIVHNNENLELISQFRVSGNDEFINFIDSMLYNKPVEPYYVNKDYDIRIFDDFKSWHSAIVEKIEQDSGKSRMLSGDIFPWVSKDARDAFDIEIDGIKLQWNKDSLFASDEEQRYRVGHIDTVQGLEFNYIGLIIGNDLLYSNENRITTDYTTHPTNAGHFRRHARRNPLPEDLERIDLIIRNTYNVLLKRGIKGCYIYCLDAFLREYLKTIIIY